MATFQGFTFHMPTRTVSSSKEDKPELDMDLDEIMKARSTNTPKSKDRQHYRNERNIKKEPKLKNSKTTNKTDKKKSNKKSIEIRIPEAALREILLQAGIKTENYNLKLVAERK